MLRDCSTRHYRSTLKSGVQLSCVVINSKAKESDQFPLFFLIYILVQAWVLLGFFPFFLTVSFLLFSFKASSRQWRCHRSHWAEFKLRSLRCYKRLSNFDHQLVQILLFLISQWVKGKQSEQKVHCPKYFLKSHEQLNDEFSYVDSLLDQAMTALQTDISNIWEEESLCKNHMFEFHVWELITSHRLIIH